MKDELSDWKITEVPSQKGRSFIVTGTAGIGYETALVLAKAGAEVILAGRNAGRGEESITKIRKQVPSADISFEIVDLANLASIREFAERIRKKRQSLDVLINNAGLMSPRRRMETADGFELQFGTNYIGPFVLTNELMPLLRKGKNPLVITVSSIASNNGRINFDDLQSKKRYNPMAGYRQSKLADLMFSFELQRRSEAEGWGITSIAVHPGVADTKLFRTSPDRNIMIKYITRVLMPMVMKPASKGAWPLIFAATSPLARGGEYYGPNGFREINGRPALARVPNQATDQAAAKKLWEVTEKLSRVRFGQINTGSSVSA